MGEKEQHIDEWQYRLSQWIFRKVEPVLIVLLKAATWVVNRMIVFLRWIQGDKK